MLPPRSMRIPSKSSKPPIIRTPNGSLLSKKPSKSSTLMNIPYILVRCYTIELSDFSSSFQPQTHHPRLPWPPTKLSISSAGLDAPPERQRPNNAGAHCAGLVAGAERGPKQVPWLGVLGEFGFVFGVLFGGFFGQRLVIFLGCLYHFWGIKRRLLALK